MKQIQSHPIVKSKTTQYIIYALLIITLYKLAQVTFIYFDWDTGLNDAYIKKKEGFEYRPYKTLWDWMQLLIVPLALVIGGYLLNRSEKNREIQAAKDKAALDRKLAKDQMDLDRQTAKIRNEEKVLTEYIDRIAELILEKGLLASAKEDPIRNVAVTMTMTAFQRLTEDRLSQVFNFLMESRLLISKYYFTENPIIDLDSQRFPNCNFTNIHTVGIILNNCSFENFEMMSAKLQYSRLNKCNFENAKLTETIFYQANLEGSDFSEADLNYTKLQYANFDNCKLTKASLNEVRAFQASFTNAELDEAEMNHSDFTDVNFENAYLLNAKIKSSRLDQANLKGAVLLGVDFSGTCLDNTDFENAEIVNENQLLLAYYKEHPPINLPEGIIPPRKRRYTHR